MGIISHPEDTIQGDVKAKPMAQTVAHSPDVAQIHRRQTVRQDTTDTHKANVPCQITVE